MDIFFFTKITYERWHQPFLPEYHKNRGSEVHLKTTRTKSTLHSAFHTWVVIDKDDVNDDWQECKPRRAAAPFRCLIRLPTCYVPRSHTTWTSANKTRCRQIRSLVVGASIVPFHSKINNTQPQLARAVFGHGMKRVCELKEHPLISYYQTRVENDFFVHDGPVSSLFSHFNGRTILSCLNIFHWLRPNVMQQSCRINAF